MIAPTFTSGQSIQSLHSFDARSQRVNPKKGDQSMNKKMMRKREHYALEKKGRHTSE
jgi:hypothetical protein